MLLLYFIYARAVAGPSGRSSQGWSYGEKNCTLHSNIVCRETIHLCSSILLRKENCVYMSSEFPIEDATLETCHCRYKFHLLKSGSAEVWAKVKSHCSGKKVRSAILGFSSLTRGFCLVRSATATKILRLGAGKVAGVEVEKTACCAAAVALYPRLVVSETPITQ